MCGNLFTWSRGGYKKFMKLSEEKLGKMFGKILGSKNLILEYLYGYLIDFIKIYGNLRKNIYFRNSDVRVITVG